MKRHNRGHAVIKTALTLTASIGLATLVANSPSGAAAPTVAWTNIALPASSYIPSAAEQAIILDKWAASVRNCMAQRGFDWSDAGVGERTAQNDRASDQRRYGVSDLSLAEQYGYHPAPETQVGTTSTSVMSARELAAFAGGTAAHPSCIEMNYYLLASLSTRAAADIKGQGFIASQDSPIVLQAFHDWSSCMLKSGYKYKSPLDSIADLRWRTKEPTAMERQVAITDVHCKTASQLTQKWSSIEASLEDPEIASQKSLLVAQESQADEAAAISTSSMGEPQALPDVAAVSSRKVSSGAYNPNNVRAGGTCGARSSCLYWNKSLYDAFWQTFTCYWTDLAGQQFNSNPNGNGYLQQVKNNAASAVDATPETLYIYYNEYYSGNYDYLSPDTYANSLYYALNEDASMKFPC